MRIKKAIAQVKGRGVQRPLKKRCWDHGCGRVGGEGWILKAERRGKQHVALSALAGDWRFVTNTEGNRKCRVSTDQCCETV